MTDKELIIEFNNGSQLAFASLYERLYSGVYYFARKFVTADDAADVAADVFFRLFRCDEKFESIANTKAWLMVNTRNACIDRLRREKYRNVAYKEILYRLSTDQPNWLDEQDRRERRQVYLELIHKAVLTFTEEKQTIFRLAFLEGLKNPEIAATLNVDERKIRDAKSRILSTLKRTLSKESMAYLSNFL
jgi:RNA polymerase sigma factor (sigma-70 family)